MRRTHQFTATTFPLLGAAALAAALLTSCDGDEPDTVAAADSDDVDADASEATGDAPADAEAPDAEAVRTEIVENLLEAGYLDDAITVDDGGLVIVGGDAIVTLEASREMVGLTRRGEPEGGDESFRQYRTPGVVSTTIDNICVNGAAFAGIAELNAGLDSAISRYNAQNLSFNMTRTSGSTAGCDAVITGVLTGGSGGLAGFPAGGLPFDTINIGSGVAAYGTAVSSHVIEHELGHCIGLRHTDWFDRSLSCGSGGAESAGTHIPNTPTGNDPDSVMSACYNGSRTGVFSAEDLDALHFIYGRDCCASGDGAGCGNVPVNECVGAADPYCNDVFWDSLCAGEVTSLGCGSCPAPVDHSCCTTGAAGCENNVIELGVCASDSYCCDVAWDGICVSEVASLGFGLCGSTCCGPHGTPGCDSGAVQACVCADDPYCCGTAWDGLCVAEVESLGCSQCG
jgi:hypothetical protein